MYIVVMLAGMVCVVRLQLFFVTRYVYCILYDRAKHRVRQSA